MFTITTVLGSLLSALRHVRVWLLVWGVVTIVAAFAVWPLVDATASTVARHPGASRLVDQALDADLARAYPHVAIDLLPGVVLMLLFGAFVSGGVLSRVAIAARPFEFTSFCTEGVRLLPRNLRVLALGVLVAALVAWGRDACDDWLRRGVLYDTEPGAVVIPLWLVDVRWAHLLELLDYAWGFLFLAVVFTSKVAMAHLASADRRSAFVAWGVAIGKVLRRPFRACGCLLLLVVLWLGLSTLAGRVVSELLEVRGLVVAGAIASQATVAFWAIVFVAHVLIARRFHTPVQPEAVSE